jgi:hypothetical protein
LGWPVQYVDVSTTATTGGSKTVCLSYVGVTFGGSGTPALYHYSGGAWHNVTTSADTTNRIICGTTSSLSPFVLGLPARTPTPAPAAGPGAQTISFGLPASGLAGSSVALAAVATSGLAPTYASTTPAVCTVSGATLSLLTAGTCSVTATQPGDGVTWTAAAPVSASITVLSPSPVKARSAVRLLGRLNLVGLPVSRLTLSTYPTKVIVARISASWGLKGTTIELWTRTTGGTWHKLTTRVLDATGHASVKLAVTRSATYRWRSGGTSVYLPAWSNSVTLTVR